MQSLRITRDRDGFWWVSTRHWCGYTLPEYMPLTVTKDSAEVRKFIAARRRAIGCKSKDARR